MNVAEHDFDIWLHGFAAETREAPHHALSRVFGISRPAAEALLATLPRVVRRDASAAQAERIVQALEAIGGRADRSDESRAGSCASDRRPARERPETIVDMRREAGHRLQPGLDSTTAAVKRYAGTKSWPRSSALRCGDRRSRAYDVNDTW